MALKKTMASCCSSFGACASKCMPSYPTFVRGLTFFAAFLIVFASLFAFTFTVEFVGKLSECDNEACDQMRMTAIESSMGSFAIHFFLIAVSALVVAAELHLSFVAWYFGFMAFRFGRGLSLVICGFVAFSYSRAFVTALERSEHAPKDASLFLLSAGITASIIGVMNLVISVLPQCCTAWHLPKDKLAIEICEMHESVRHCRAKEKIAADKKALDFKSSTSGDAEMGEAKPQERSSRRSSRSSGRKSSELPAPSKLPPPSVSAKQTSVVVEENPFVKAAGPPEENPFIANKGADKV